MRILVTGANGQVGHELLRALNAVEWSADATGSRLPPLPQSGGRASVGGPEDPSGSRLSPFPRAGEIIPATRDGKLEDGTPCERIDLVDPDGLRRALDRVAPDVIINAAAYTAVDRAEDEPGLAQRINGGAVGEIGRWAKQHGARVVHYSTDYVFDGAATRPYREDAATHPLGVYGRSKLAGEVALRESGARHLILRTAWVYAARGKNFLLTMLRLGGERDELRVVDDQLGAPTPAALIADVTVQVVKQWVGEDAPARDGTYHLVASGQTSWCGFARAIFERAQRMGMLECAPRVTAIPTADYPTKATRPAYSVLDTLKLREAFKVELPAWSTALDGVIDELG